MLRLIYWIDKFVRDAVYYLFAGLFISTILSQYVDNMQACIDAINLFSGCGLITIIYIAYYEAIKYGFLRKVDKTGKLYKYQTATIVSKRDHIKGKINLILIAGIAAIRLTTYIRRLVMQLDAVSYSNATYLAHLVVIEVIIIFIAVLYALYKSYK